MTTQIFNTYPEFSISMLDLENFYALTAKCDRESQNQVNALLVHSINLSLGGDFILAGETLLEAHWIITDTLDRDKRYKLMENDDFYVPLVGTQNH